MINRTLAGFVIILLLSISTNATTFIITTTSDSGDGSLRKAITDANTTLGADSIFFNIPKADPNFSSSTGVWTIQPASQLPEITDLGLLIDGTSQSKFVGENTNPFGPEIEISGARKLNFGLNILTHDVIVQHLVINRFVNTEISIYNADFGIIAGCYVGTNASGTDSLGDCIRGIEIGSSKHIQVVPLDTIPNIISGHDDMNIFIVNSATSNRIFGNIIGLNRTADRVIDPDACSGIIIQDADSNLVQNNRIGSPWIGIVVSNSSTANNIFGNLIGTDEHWQLHAGSKLDGVRFWDAGGNTVTDNIIAYSYNGVYVNKPGAIGNKISQNAISNNTNLGILNENGGNKEIPPPNIQLVSSTLVSGIADSGQTIEVYSDIGNQGQVFLGMTTADGSGRFSLPLPFPPPLRNVTAIAIDSEGNTSEFSTSVQTDIAEKKGSATPQQFTLEQNYPNPFSTQSGSLYAGGNPKTKIGYDLPKSSHVRLAIYDILGHHIRTLVDTRQAAGHFQTVWNGIDELGAPSPAGMYFCRMEVGGSAKVIKLALVK